MSSPGTIALQARCNAINSRVQLMVLKDGCFRAADRDDALVLFPFGAKLFVDSSRVPRLSAAASIPATPRVGEAVEFQGSIHEVTLRLSWSIASTPPAGRARSSRWKGMASAAAGDTAEDKVTDRANAMRAVWRTVTASMRGRRSVRSTGSTRGARPIGRTTPGRHPGTADNRRDDG